METQGLRFLFNSFSPFLQNYRAIPRFPEGSGKAGLPLACNVDIIPWFEENVQGVGEDEMISVRVA